MSPHVPQLGPKETSLREGSGDSSVHLVGAKEDPTLLHDYGPWKPLGAGKPRREGRKEELCLLIKKMLKVGLWKNVEPGMPQQGPQRTGGYGMAGIYREGRQTPPDWWRQITGSAEGQGLSRDAPEAFLPQVSLFSPRNEEMIILAVTQKHILAK